MEELGLGRTGLGSESLGSLGGARSALELLYALLPASKRTGIPLYKDNPVYGKIFEIFKMFCELGGFVED